MLDALVAVAAPNNRAGTVTRARFRARSRQAQVPVGVVGERKSVVSERKSVVGVWAIQSEGHLPEARPAGAVPAVTIRIAHEQGALHAN